MKNLVLKSFLFISLLIVHFHSFSQENPNPYSGNIIAGTNRWFIISLYNQPPVKAKIPGIDGDGIIIKESQDKYVYPRKIELSMISDIEEITSGKRGSAGAGYGIPYGGVLGVSCDLNVIPFLSFSGAVGTTVLAGFGFNVGAKACFRKPGPLWRTGASIFYGTNAIWFEDFGHPNNQNYTGLNAGLG